MTKRIFRSILSVSLTAILICLVVVTCVLYDSLFSIQKSRLRTELELAAAGVEINGSEYLDCTKFGDYRLTWVSHDGTVLFDSKADPATMDSHADREEIKEALTSGIGESERYSSTLTAKTLYAAKLLSDGTILRISTENATVISLIFGMIYPIVFILIVIFILAGLLASRISKRIVEPLNELDLENPLEGGAYDELSPLLRRINQLHGQVDTQMKELKRKTDEFEQITGNMNEGLVLIDDKGKVISINNAAKKLFGCNSSCIGNDFITVDRNSDLNEIITRGYGELRIEKSGREYQLEISRIESEGSAIGAALIAFDVTDKVFAERNRKEFTANVSHELKSPLQSIMGSAELIENGLVKPEDMPRFVGHIRTESARLVALIEDIIRLSQLDEKNDMPTENVDLFEVASGVVDELTYIAEKKNVSLHVSGEKADVKGVRKLLTEIVYNLCDNAIKYNKDGGKVDISVTLKDNNAVLSVKDNGIGIPPEQQNRVFERFYRVDKSHSKESGGTGLGLSIVKHAVAFHHGKVELTSNPGKGSEFVVTIPVNRTENA